MSISIYCPHCKKHTALTVAQAHYRGDPGLPTGSLAMWAKSSTKNWWIGICNACEEPCLILNDGEEVYPHPRPSPTDAHIPKDIARDLDEAKACLSVNCYRACAVMARRCIQSACIAKGATAGNLIHQVSELQKLGIITRDVQEWATVVRWVGNDAAHPGGDKVTKDDAEDCLKLAEQFLHVIFVTSAVAKARRAARGK